MDILGLFIFDPLVKRVRKMSRIQKELLEIADKRKKLDSDALELTKEYEILKQEAKSLKKTGSLPQ